MSFPRDSPVQLGKNTGALANGARDLVANPFYRLSMVEVSDNKIHA